MAPIIRILLHILFGVLVTRGLMTQSVADMLRADPDVQVIIELVAGVAASAAAWGWYFLAKRFGWRT